MKIVDNILPKVLVIDDLFGALLKAPLRNTSRDGLCSKFQLHDITGDQLDRTQGIHVKNPIAEAIFCRAQVPVCSTVNDVVKNDLAGCLNTVKKGWHVDSGVLPWSLVLLDLCFYTGKVTEESNRLNLGMPEGGINDDNPKHYFGLTILEAIRKEFPNLPVVILSSMSRAKVNKQFSKFGAFGFLDRTSSDSPALLKDYIRRHGLFPDQSGQIIGKSKPILMAMRTARRIASSRRNVLIRGPRGSGKGVMSKYIHNNSDRKDQSFVAVNLGGTNPNLFESLLFGHVKGAFTGADKNRKGFIEEADKGTLFIDEIAGISSEVQYSLLHVLEDNKVTPVGSNQTKNIDVHFISATNEEIETKVISGVGFRLDLLDRLREGGILTIPSLAERKDDIPLFVESFVQEAEEHFNALHHRQVTTKAMEKLITYPWPGNIRELRQCIFEAVAENIDVEYLVPDHIRLHEMSSHSEIEFAHINKIAPSQILSPELEEFINIMSTYNFDSLCHDDLVGRLLEIESSCNKFIGNYLKATIERTLDPISGKIMITRAVKMATGDSQITATKAADLIKRLLKGLTFDSEEDNLLKESLERSIEIRPKNPKTK